MTCEASGKLVMLLRAQCWRLFCSWAID